MSGGCTQEAGNLARFRTALSHLWLPIPTDGACLRVHNTGLTVPGRDSQQPPAPGAPDTGERLSLVTPDGLALCTWRALEPGHVICTAFHCAGAYRGLVHPSALIWGAEVWAWDRWPRARLTVRLRRSAQVWPDPASFFVQALWKQAGIDRTQRVLLEKLPICVGSEP